MAAVFTEANDRLGAIRGFGFACFVYGLRCECAALFFQPAAAVCAGTKRMKSGCKRSCSAFARFGLKGRRPLQQLSAGPAFAFVAREIIRRFWAAFGRRTDLVRAAEIDGTVLSSFLELCAAHSKARRSA